jgi:hypothetical protein
MMILEGDRSFLYEWHKCDRTFPSNTKKLRSPITGKISDTVGHANKVTGKWGTGN